RGAGPRPLRAVRGIPARQRAGAGNLAGRKARHRPGGRGMSYGRCFTVWRAAAGSHWDDYVRHRFVQGMADGTLPRAGFLNYLVQDYRFLIHFSRAWGLGIVKADTLDEMRACAATVD